MSIIAWLRTPVATLIVLCAALLAQLPHAADVFRIIVSGSGLPAVLHGYAYAVALELAVLLFVVQRRNIESYIFACVSVLINLSYYSLHGVALLSIAALPAWLVSIALPAAIARYSHLLVESPAETKPVNTLANGATTIAVVETSAEKGIDAPSNAPSPSTASVAVSPVVATPRKAKRKSSAKLTPAQRRAQIASAGLLDPAQIVSQFAVSARTAQADLAALRKATTKTNGVHA